MKKILILFLKGCAMGSADLVPGISGATIALVLNIYPRFVSAIKNILSYWSLKLLLRLRFKEFFYHGQLDFLLPVVVGIFTVIFTLSHLISYLLESQPVLFWSFFFGLILASALVLPNYRDNFNLEKIALVVAGVVIGYSFVSLTSFRTPNTPFMMFITGLSAMSAMILPGISGSFVMVIIGKYEFFVNSIKTLNIPVLLSFAMGGALALFFITRLIELLFKKIEQVFIAFIAGFLIGSLKVIWPWELTNPSTGEVVKVSPFYYENITGSSHQLGLAILLALTGAIVILLFNRLEKLERTYPPNLSS